MELKEKKCALKGCDNYFKQFRSFDKYCSYQCFNEAEKQKPPKVEKPKAKRPRITRPKPIRQVSKKREKEMVIYSRERKEFLQGKTCFVEGCNLPADTIEHTKGRQGYADEWARDNKISLYLDKRFWQPCCLGHNLEFERNPELSKKYQLSKIHDGKKI